MQVTQQVTKDISETYGKDYHITQNVVQNQVVKSDKMNEKEFIIKCKNDIIFFAERNDPHQPSRSVQFDDIS